MGFVRNFIAHFFDFCEKIKMGPKFFPPTPEFFFTITSLRIENVVAKLQSGCESDEKWPRNGDGRVSRSMQTVLAPIACKKRMEPWKKSRSSDF